MKRIALLLLFAVAVPSDAGAPLTMSVSPAAAREPASVTVRAIVESDADNRALEIVAQSPDFYRSSYVELNGANAQRLNVFQFKNLPSGTYRVTSVLVGSRGPRAAAAGYVQIAPSIGN